MEKCLNREDKIKIKRGNKLKSRIKEMMLSWGTNFKSEILNLKVKKKAVVKSIKNSLKIEAIFYLS